MSLNHAKRRRIDPQPWDGDHPATTLSALAVEILHLVREHGNFARRGLSRNRMRLALGGVHEPWQITAACREIRASVYAGQYRPHSRVRIPDATRARVYNRDGWQCQNPDCGERNQNLLTLDHHPVPYARGGPDHHTNLRTLCKPCNETLGCEEGDDRA